MINGNLCISAGGAEMPSAVPPRDLSRLSRAGLGVVASSRIYAFGTICRLPVVSPIPGQYHNSWQGCLLPTVPTQLYLWVVARMPLASGQRWIPQRCPLKHNAACLIDLPMAEWLAGREAMKTKKLQNAFRQNGIINTCFEKLFMMSDFD